MADWDAIEKEFMPIRDRLLMTPGNHDGAYGSEDINGDGQISGSTDYYIYNLTPGEVYDLVLRKTGLIDGVVFDESKNGYYVDDNVSKVRYILVNTHYTDGAVNADGTAVNNIMRKIRVGQPQMNMVISALNGIPSEDWTVIVGMHIPLAPLSDSGPSADMVLLRDVLEAYQGKTTYTNTFGVAGEYDYLNIDVDFTAAHGTVVGAFCGHIHRDGVNTDYSFPVVTSYSDDTSATNIFGDVEDGTIQKHSFDVFTVNRNENIIYATKFGYGEDRVIGMGNMFWRVFLSLDGANASNTEQVVEKNGSYTTTITAKAGYTIESVVVTMGGVDITADVYADGVITIGSVTGDVSITVASAVLYTNLADPTSEDWYSESHFINTDGEFLQTTAPYTETLFVTNFIPVKKFDILRWKGINMEALVSGYGCGIRCYDENKEFIRTVATMESTRGTASGLPTSCATDENGVTAWEIMIRGDTNQQFTYNSLCDKIRYVRFCAHWLTTVEDIIITVNEEIVPSEDNPGDDVVTLYTNLADPSSEDWMEAASYNAGVIDRYQYSEYRGTNFIPVNTNDVLRFKGVDISDDNYNLLVCYDEHKEYLIALGLGASHSNSIAPVMSTDENGVSSYTILMRGSTGQQWVYNDLYTKTKYIRFYGGRDVVAEDVIITVNEEII